MGRVLIIGAGGVSTVAVKKIAMNADVFTDIMLASRTKSKCDAIAAAIKNVKIQTAQVDADNVDELIKLFNSFKPELVVNLALPYQDLTIMDACLACGVNYLDTANYEPIDEAKYEYSWQWAYQDRFKEAGLTAILGCGFDPGVTEFSLLMQQNIILMKFNTWISWIVMPVIITRLLQPTSIRKSIFARLLRRVNTGKTASGWKQNHRRYISRLTTPTSVRVNRICCITRSWSRLPRTSRLSNVPVSG